MRQKNYCTTVDTGGSHLESICQGLWDLTVLKIKTNSNLELEITTSEYNLNAPY